MEKEVLHTTMLSPRIIITRRWFFLLVVVVGMLILTPSTAAAKSSSLERRNNDDTAVYQLLVLPEEDDDESLVMSNNNKGPAAQRKKTAFKDVVIPPDGSRTTTFDYSFDPVLDRDPRRSKSSGALRRELSGFLQRKKVLKRFEKVRTTRGGKGKGKGSTTDGGSQGNSGGKSGGGKSGQQSVKCGGKQGKGSGTTSEGKGGKGLRKSKFRGKGKGNQKCDDDNDETPSVSPSPTIPTMQPTTATPVVQTTGNPTECPIDEIVRWILVNADLRLPDAEIRTLSTPVDTIVLDDIIAKNLNIVVQVDDPGDCTESVQFVATGGISNRIESTVPYALGSDDGGGVSSKQRTSCMRFFVSQFIF
jgi:hypothetical protein